MVIQSYDLYHVVGPLHGSFILFQDFSKDGFGIAIELGVSKSAPRVLLDVFLEIFTAYLFDAQGRPVTDGEQVIFSISPNTPTIVNGATQSVTAGSVAAEYISTATGTFQVQCMIKFSGICDGIELLVGWISADNDVAFLRGFGVRNALY